MSRSSKLKVGIAGWSYPDWNGVVYPARLKLSQLKFLAQFFEVIEVNSTFYRIPAISVVERWCQEIAGETDFRFTVKLLKDFTHARGAADLMGGNFSSIAEGFKQAIQPLASEKRLGALLIQFPHSFHKNPKNLAYMKRLVEEFAEFPVVVEVRHRSFASPEFFEFMRKLRAGFVNIDQPPVSFSIGPTEQATSDVGYVRFHGRNLAHWFDENATRDQRYDYSYTQEQLQNWVSRVEKLVQSTKVVYAIFNNHFRGQEVANALEFLHLWTERPVRIPPLLKKHYPRLKSIAEESATASPEEMDSLPLFPDG